MKFRRLRSLIWNNILHLKRKMKNDFRSLAVLTTMVGTPSDHSIIRINEFSECIID
ncbi:hypothetical protein [Nostoc sp. TCL240-02]|uniref:hypothetical protein n=1 Tax=Nostoc sp. TCL240-02 TaxID=2572090 RepID=UPI00157F8690|nr:hypothetical protein [Nostoc sp. TCL240-02]